ncbi:MAG: class III poly(R)-hydroxyalkanoic acid synthase subunit PhaE [Gammaproteobacteria bacterium]
MTGFADTSNAWSQAWLDMQKQYMDTWMKFSPQGTPGSFMTSPFAATGPNPWTDAFEQWSKLFSQGMPANAREVSSRLFDLGKGYLDMSERFWQVMQQGKDSPVSATDWQGMMQKTFEQAGKGFNFPGGATDPWSGFATLWGLPLSNWQRMATSFSPFPGEMEKALRADHLPEPSEMTRAVRHGLSLPPIGYTREWQEQQQEWTRLLMEYQHTVQAFGGLLGKVVQRALELFGKRMTEKLGAGESFDGLRAIYNLWIDCGEDAYAELVASTDFPHLQAEMINALMRMKRHEQLMLEEVMTALNMPTRSEMDTTHKRVYELQQQVCHLQDALEDAADVGTAPPKARKTATKKSATKKSGTAARRARPKTRKE